MDNKIYSVTIDLTIEDSFNAVTYGDDAVGFTPASGNDGNFIWGSWENIYPYNVMKPCLFKDGNVVCYLNKNDYTKDINGNSVDIISGQAGDVMIEIPKIWYSIENVNRTVVVKMASSQINSSYRCMGHTRGNSQVDKVYIGAFLGSVSDNKLRSVSNVKPKITDDIAEMRTYAHNKGKNYEVFPYYQHQLLQVLYIVAFKNTKITNALGAVFIPDDYYEETYTGVNTGITNNLGFNYGKKPEQNSWTDESGFEWTYDILNDPTLRIKLFGIEDIIGNGSQYIDGILRYNDEAFLIGNNNFNSTGAGYKNVGDFDKQYDPYSYYSGTAENVFGGEAGFLPYTVVESGYSFSPLEYVQYTDQGINAAHYQYGLFSYEFYHNDEYAVYQKKMGRLCYIPEGKAISKDNNNTMHPYIEMKDESINCKFNYNDINYNDSETELYHVIVSEGRMSMLLTVEWLDPDKNPREFNVVKHNHLNLKGIDKGEQYPTGSTENISADITIVNSMFDVILEKYGITLNSIEVHNFMSFESQDFTFTDNAKRNQLYD